MLAPDPPLPTITTPTTHQQAATPVTTSKPSTTTITNSVLPNTTPITPNPAAVKYEIEDIVSEGHVTKRYPSEASDVVAENSKNVVENPTNVAENPINIVEPPTNVDPAGITTPTENIHPKRVASTGNISPSDNIAPAEKSVPYIVKAEKMDPAVRTTEAPNVVAPEAIDEREDTSQEGEDIPSANDVNVTSVDAGNGTAVASTQVDLLADAEGNSVSEEQLEPVIKPFREWAEKRQQEEKKKVKVVAREAAEGREVEGERVEVKASGSSNQPGTAQLQAVLKSNGGGAKLTKNFATPDCSAKIVAANPESQGASNVISHSKDEYFLNKCTDKSWFVVELCESIKALKVQLANFELYSSSPKEVRVSLGNVWPGRAQDWVEFGTFLYKDERAVQTFKSEQVG